MYDLTVKAKTPGQPTVLLAANVTAAAADKLVKRLAAVDLTADGVSSVRITPHEPGVTVENQAHNAANAEVLMAVLAHRELTAPTEG